MKCKICGSECPPGGKICRDCAAARKRAFAATVTQPLLAAAGVPSVSTPRFAPKPPKPARPSGLLAVVHDASRPEAPPALPLNVVPKSLGVHWLLIGVAIATTIVVLVVKVISSGSHPTEEATAPELVMATAPTAAAATPLPPVAAEAHPQPELPASTKASEVAVAKHPAEKASRKAATRPEPIKPTVTPLPAPEPAPVARAPALPARPVEAPRADPWQAMNEGLSRCAREDLFSRAACEQRLRLQYCPNYWGLVPQCPIGPSTDHGQ